MRFTIQPMDIPGTKKSSGKNELPAGGPVRGHRAFSLIEVVIAIGIFSFAFIALLGLVPVALQASRDSLDLSNATHLANFLKNEVTRTNFGSSPVSPRWFDASLDEATSADGIYEAEVLLSDSISPNLRRLQIKIEKGTSERAFCFLIFNSSLR